MFHPGSWYQEFQIILSHQNISRIAKFCFLEFEKVVWGGNSVAFPGDIYTKVNI